MRNPLKVKVLIRRYRHVHNCTCLYFVKGVYRIACCYCITHSLLDVNESIIFTAVVGGSAANINGGSDVEFVSMKKINEMVAVCTREKRTEKGVQKAAWVYI